MIKVSEIINQIEEFAPLTLAEEWDNSGWQINLDNEFANKIMICLSVDLNVINQAVIQGCDLIISHHPLIFKPIKKIQNATLTDKTIVEAVKHNIQIYSAHTNLDAAEGGINDILCERLGLEVINGDNKFVKIGALSEPMNLESFILKLKISLNCSKVKLINPDNITEIKTVAVSSGAGAEFINELPQVDAFITGDVKYHSAMEVQNMALIDAGHFETEKIILQTIKTLLEKTAKDIVIAKEKNPWIIV
ncbi:MAG: Nif3-like dinuclear metal center hexameric protein [Candidatus Gastranaerophilales bacterium]|nr:Nif3-like dinuclear metal center hexameric protein [Candidatus Gastranaerophilales bacterium]